MCRVGVPCLLPLQRGCTTLLLRAIEECEAAHKRYVPPLWPLPLLTRAGQQMRNCTPPGLNFPCLSTTHPCLSTSRDFRLYSSRAWACWSTSHNPPPHTLPLPGSPPPSIPSLTSSHLRSTFNIQHSTFNHSPQFPHSTPLPSPPLSSYDCKMLQLQSH
jgi:hypothetical protein